MISMEKILEIKNLVISFRINSGKVHAVRDISFDLNKGETMAIVGESGSGKSAVACSIMGVLAPNAIVEGGQILYDGKDLLNITERELCKLRGSRISIVFQDASASLNPIIKVGKQIIETMLLNGKMSKKAAKEKGINLMREVGISEAEKVYNQYPFELSGGMKQRVVIAIALAADPDILICDEATASLDVTIQSQILELICKLRDERGLSVMFISHDFGVVAKVADRVAVMYAGKIVEYGKTEEIFYDPKHPYTWALLASTPDLYTKEKLEAIPGTPPDMLCPPKGDAFAARNKYAMRIDFERQPPMFKVSDTHYAATWLLHPYAPKQPLPDVVTERIVRMKELEWENGKQK